MLIPKGRGVRRTACSADRSSTCLTIPAIPPRRALLPFPAFPIPSACLPTNATDMPKIPTTPISYGDAKPILENLSGPESPRDWQGALPFTYHVGPGPVKVKLHLKQEYRYFPIWDVIGKIPGARYHDEWVVLGNHRDAWVYGAVDPNSGTAAMLETVHGLGELIKQGWKP